MKKFGLAIPIVLLGFTLAACGHSDSANKSTATNSSTSQSTTTTNSSTSQSTAPSSSTSADAASTSSTQNQSKKIAIKQASTTSRIGQLNHQLQAALGDIALPQADGLDKGSSNLNVRYTGDTNNYQIFYSVGNRPSAFNATTLSKQNPYATLKKETFSSNAQAAAQINHIDAQSNKGLPTTDLGSGLTGYSDMGAGNIHLLWNEGNWSLSVHAINIENQDPTPMAKKVVQLLNTYSLPAPNKYGQIQFDVNINPGARNQIIKWQDQNIVYTIEAHDPTTAIKFAASIK